MDDFLAALKSAAAVVAALLGWLGLGMLYAGLGRALAHYHMVLRGQRRPWSWELLWELPTALFCFLIGMGIAQYFALPYWTSHAVIALCAWFGPRGAERIICQILDYFFAKKTL